MKLAKSNSKRERAANARATAGGSNEIASFASAGPIKLQREQSDGTVQRIARVLRRRRPDLGEDPADEAGAVYLASSLVAYSVDKDPQTIEQWCSVLSEVLTDACMTLDDEENDVAVRWVIKELVRTNVLHTLEPRIEPGSLVLGVLTEDGQWHEAFVQSALEDGQLRLVFLEYGKPQDTAASDIRAMDTIVDDGDTEGKLQEGDCEMCGRHLLLTFHHLIPKDTHPTYLKKRLPAGIEGEPTRSFLNTYGTMVCRQCHSYIHSLASNEVLAKEYNTLTKILEHPRVQRWVEWAGKQRNGKWAA